MKTIRIGAGAGYSGDRIEPALDLMEKGHIQYIVFECLAERSIALAQLRKAQDPNQGYNELLEYRMRRVLPLCAAKQITVITNMGAAHPLAALHKVKQIAQSLGLHALKLAAVIGDDVFPQIERYSSYTILETGQPVAALGSSLLSANAYIGAHGIVQALRGGADVVITGRVADPTLFLAPMIVEFGWSMEQYDLLGKGTLAGHLLECSAQVTGGYFADPGYKDVPDLANIGFPIAEISAHGDVTITKLPEAGGMVTAATVKEQLLYEIHDPAQYHTPDVIADFSQVTVTELAPDSVQVSGASGKARSGLYKTSIGYRDGFLVEGEISYGGAGAYQRAALAGEIVQQRLAMRHIPVRELRIDYIGVNALYRDSIAQQISPSWQQSADVRLRVAAHTSAQAHAEQIGHEVEALYTNGPAGGGGVRIRTTEVLAIGSILIPAADIQVRVIYEEV